MAWLILLLVAGVFIYYIIKPDDYQGNTITSDTGPKESAGNSFFFRVAGVEYNNKEHAINAFCRPGTDLVLVHEKKNKYDPNAIAVWTIKPKRKIGYVPKKYNQMILPHLHDNIFRAYVDDVSRTKESEIFGKIEAIGFGDSDRTILDVTVIVELKRPYIPSK